MNLVIFGQGKPVEMVILSLLDKGINIINVEQDKVRGEKEQDAFSSFLKTHNIKLNKFTSISEEEIDMIFVINYKKIINLEEVKNDKIINLHIGLLPKYRGNSANSWAIMNGEKEVGYTIHKVNQELDQGDIYYRFAYEVKEMETYFNAKTAINNDIKANLASVLVKINKNEITPKSQSGEEFIYTIVLRPSDGTLKEWNVTTDQIIRKLYIFAKPLGTGLKFEFKGKTYFIEKVSRIENFVKSVGISGSVLYFKNNSVWIKTADTAISLDKITFEGKEVNVKKTFIIGQRF